MHAPFGGLCLARPHSLSLSPPPDYALLERLFERASPLTRHLNILFERATPLTHCSERLFERALARASACASLHIERLPAAVSA